MTHNLFQNIYKHPLIGAQELQQIQKAHQPVAFRKGDFILRKNEIARGYLILQIGVARAFVYDYEGNDITTDFFCEGEIIVQELSLFKHLPSAAIKHAPLKHIATYLGITDTSLSRIRKEM